MPPPSPFSCSQIGRGLCAPGCLERIKSGGKNMLSVSQNNICLPARAFKTINKITEHTMATVPLLPPSLYFSFRPPPPPVFPPILFSLICQYNADIQRFVCTSSPKGAQNLLMQADSNSTHTDAKTNTEINTEINTFMPKAGFSLSHTCLLTHPPLACGQLALCETNPK